MNDAPFSGDQAWTFDGCVVAQSRFAPMPDSEALKLAESILHRKLVSAHVDAAGTLVVVELGKLDMVNVTVTFER